jgi:hypothetical protein
MRARHADAPSCDTGNSGLDDRTNTVLKKIRELQQQLQDKVREMRQIMSDKSLTPKQRDLAHVLMHP